MAWAEMLSIRKVVRDDGVADRETGSLDRSLRRADQRALPVSILVGLLVVVCLGAGGTYLLIEPSGDGKAASVVERVRNGVYAPLAADGPPQQQASLEETGRGSRPEEMIGRSAPPAARTSDEHAAAGALVPGANESWAGARDVPELMAKGERQIDEGQLDQPVGNNAIDYHLVAISPDGLAVTSPAAPLDTLSGAPPQNAKPAADGVSAGSSTPPPPAIPTSVTTTASAIEDFPRASGSFAMARGRELLRQGDVTGARRFFELAHSDGTAGAAAAIAITYDPRFLRAASVRGYAGDPSAARWWYEEALNQDDKRAVVPLQRLLRDNSLAATAGPPR